MQTNQKNNVGGHHISNPGRRNQTMLNLNVDSNTCVSDKHMNHKSRFTFT